MAVNLPGRTRGTAMSRKRLFLFPILLLLAHAFSARAQEPDPSESLETKAAQLIKDLGHDEWAVREAAFKELLSFGTPILPLVERSARNPDLEVRWRVERLCRLLRWDMSETLADRIGGILDACQSPELVRLNTVGELVKIGTPDVAPVLALIFHSSRDFNTSAVAFWDAARLAGDKELERFRKRALLPGYEDYQLLVAKARAEKGGIEEARTTFEAFRERGSNLDLLDLCEVEFALLAKDLPEAQLRFKSLRYEQLHSVLFRVLRLETPQTVAFLASHYREKNPHRWMVESKLRSGPSPLVDKILEGLALFVPRPRLFRLLGERARNRDDRKAALVYFTEALRWGPLDSDLYQHWAHQLPKDPTPKGRKRWIRELWVRWTARADEQDFGEACTYFAQARPQYVELFCELAEERPESIPVFFSVFHGKSPLEQQWAVARGGKGPALHEVLMNMAEKGMGLAELLLASILCRSDKQKRARIWLEKAREKFPDNPDVLYFVMENALALGEIDRLVGLFGKAAELPEGKRGGLMKRILGLLRSSTSRAAPRARRALFLAQQDWSVTLNLLQGLLKDTPREWVPAWREAWKKGRPESARSALLLGLVARQDEQWEDAGAWFARAVIGGPETYIARAGLVECLAHGEKWERALEEARILSGELKTNASSARVMNLFHSAGKSFPQLPECDSSILVLVELARAPGPLGANAWLRIGSRLGRKQIGLLKARFERKPDVATALALALAKNGDRPWAEEALRLAPGDPRARLSAMNSRLEAGNFEGLLELLPATPGNDTFLHLSPLWIVRALHDRAGEEALPLLLRIAGRVDGVIQHQAVLEAARLLDEKYLDFLRKPCPPREKAVREFLTGILLLGRRETAKAGAHWETAARMGFDFELTVQDLKYLMEEKDWKTPALLLKTDNYAVRNLLGSLLGKGSIEALHVLAERGNFGLEDEFEMTFARYLNNQVLGAAENLLEAKKTPSALRLLAALKIHQGAPGKALALYRKAFDMAPDEAGTVAALVSILSEGGALEEGLALYDRLLEQHRGREKDPSCVELRCRVIDAFQSQAAFRPLLEKALADPSPVLADKALEAWGHLAGPGDLERLMGKAGPHPPRMRLAVAKAHARLGHHAKASVLYRELQKEEKVPAELRYSARLELFHLLANTQDWTAFRQERAKSPLSFEQGRPDPAVSALRAEVDCGTRNAFEHLVRALLEAGEADPKRFKDLRGLFRLRAVWRDTEKVLPLLWEAFNARPGEETLAFVLAEAVTAAGTVRDAEKLYSDLLAQHRKKDPTAYTPVRIRDRVLGTLCRRRGLTGLLEAALQDPAESVRTDALRVWGYRASASELERLVRSTGASKPETKLALASLLLRKRSTRTAARLLRSLVEDRKLSLSSRERARELLFEVLVRQKAWGILAEEVTRERWEMDGSLRNLGFYNLVASSSERSGKAVLALARLLLDLEKGSELYQTGIVDAFRQWRGKEVGSRILALFRRAFEGAPDSALAVENLSIALLALGTSEDVLAHYNHLLTHPRWMTPEGVRLRRGLVLRCKDRENPLSILEEALRDPDAALRRDALSLWTRNARPEDVERMEVRLKGVDPSAGLHLGSAWLRLERYGRAADLFRCVLESPSPDEETRKKARESLFHALAGLKDWEGFEARLSRLAGPRSEQSRRRAMQIAAGQAESGDADAGRLLVRAYLSKPDPDLMHSLRLPEVLAALPGEPEAPFVERFRATADVGSGWIAVRIRELRGFREGALELCLAIMKGARKDAPERFLAATMAGKSFVESKDFDRALDVYGWLVSASYDEGSRGSDAERKRWELARSAANHWKEEGVGPLLRMLALERDAGISNMLERQLTGFARPESAASLAIKLDHPRVWRVIAEWALESGAFEEAGRCYENAVRGSPNDLTLYESWIVVALRSKNPENATEIWGKLERAARGRDRTLTAMLGSIAEKAGATVLPIMLHILREGAGRGDRFRQAAAFVCEQSDPEVREALMEEAERTPDWTGPYIQALLHRAANRREDMVRCFRDMVNRGPGSDYAVKEAWQVLVEESPVSELAFAYLALRRGDVGRNLPALAAGAFDDDKKRRDLLLRLLSLELDWDVAGELADEFDGLSRAWQAPVVPAKRLPDPAVALTYGQAALHPRSRLLWYLKAMDGGDPLHQAAMHAKALDDARRAGWNVPVEHWRRFVGAFRARNRRVAVEAVRGTVRVFQKRGVMGDFVIALLHRMRRCGLLEWKQLREIKAIEKRDARAFDKALDRADPAVKELVVGYQLWKRRDFANAGARFNTARRLDPGNHAALLGQFFCCIEIDDGRGACLAYRASQRLGLDETRAMRETMLDRCASLNNRASREAVLFALGTERWPADQDRALRALLSFRNLRDGNAILELEVPFLEPGASAFARGVAGFLVTHQVWKARNHERCLPLAESGFLANPCVERARILARLYARTDRHEEAIPLFRWALRSWLRRKTATDFEAWLEDNLRLTGCLAKCGKPDLGAAWALFPLEDEACQGFWSRDRDRLEYAVRIAGVLPRESAPPRLTPAIEKVVKQVVMDPIKEAHLAERLVEQGYTRSAFALVDRIVHSKGYPKWIIYEASGILKHAARKRAAEGTILPRLDALERVASSPELLGSLLFLRWQCLVLQGGAGAPDARSRLEAHWKGKPDFYRQFENEIRSTASWLVEQGRKEEAVRALRLYRLASESDRWRSFKCWLRQLRAWNFEEERVRVLREESSLLSTRGRIDLALAELHHSRCTSDCVRLLQEIHRDSKTEPEDRKRALLGLISASGRRWIPALAEQAVQWLKHIDPEVRKAACKAQGTMPYPPAGADLIRTALADPDPEVREAARIAAGRFSNPFSCAELSCALKANAPGAQDLVKALASTSLGNLLDDLSRIRPGGVRGPSLLDTMAREGEDARLEALLASADLPGPAVEDFLILHLFHRSLDVRRTAATALYLRRGQDLADFLGNRASLRAETLHPDDLHALLLASRDPDPLCRAFVVRCIPTFPPPGRHGQNDYYPILESLTPKPGAGDPYDRIPFILGLDDRVASRVKPLLANSDARVRAASVAKMADSHLPRAFLPALQALEDENPLVVASGAKAVGEAFRLLHYNRGWKELKDMLDEERLFRAMSAALKRKPGFAGPYLLDIAGYGNPALAERLALAALEDPDERLARAIPRHLRPTTEEELRSLVETALGRNDLARLASLESLGRSTLHDEKGREALRPLLAHASFEVRTRALEAWIALGGAWPLREAFGKMLRQYCEGNLDTESETWFADRTIDEAEVLRLLDLARSEDPAVRRVGIWASALLHDVRTRPHLLEALTAHPPAVVAAAARRILQEKPREILLPLASQLPGLKGSHALLVHNILCALTGVGDRVGRDEWKEKRERVLSFWKEWISRNGKLAASHPMPQLRPPRPRDVVAQPFDWRVDSAKGPLERLATAVFLLMEGKPDTARALLARMRKNPQDRAVFPESGMKVFEDLLGTFEGMTCVRPWRKDFRSHRGRFQKHVFFIDRMEVSREAFERFRKAERLADSRPDSCRTPLVDAPGLPALGCTRDEAKAFASWSGKRLPTPQEWHSGACLEGYLRMRKFPWGNRGSLSGSNVNGRHGRPLPVFTAGTDISPGGGVNFFGNVREWCADPPGFDGEDWLAPVQGFSWSSKGPFWTFPAEQREPADLRSPTIGLRCVSDFPRNSEILRVLLRLFEEK